MKKIFLFLAVLAVALVGVVGCLYLTPMHRERPGTNREALGTVVPSDTIDQSDDILTCEDIDSI